MIPKGKLPEGINMQDVADIAAATGEGIFKRSFRDKAFDGKTWDEAKPAKSRKAKRGSLMVKTAALLGSVRTSKSDPQKVVWTAGNDKVPYAQVHNEGGKAGRGKGFMMPKRQFMGKSKQLEAQVTKRIDAYMKNIFK